MSTTRVHTTFVLDDLAYLLVVVNSTIVKYNNTVWMGWGIKVRCLDTWK